MSEIGFNWDKLEQKYEDLPEECRHCKYLGTYYSCDLKERDEYRCPLDDLRCEDCENCCKIIKRDGEQYEYYIFCLYEEELIESGTRACREFEKPEGE